MSLSLQATVARLDKAGIPYKREDVLNGFWGTRIIFHDRKTARAAAKVLDNQFIQAHFKQFALTFY